jgi:CheY-like chemotaxis protein
MAAPVEAHPVRVLVVDDEPDTLEALCTYLGLKGLKVRCEASAEAALAAMTDFKPSVVLSDIAMPAVDGFALLKQLREKMPDIPVVAITAHGYDESVRTKIEAAGFTRVLAKPIDPRSLLDVIAAVIR